MLIIQMMLNRCMYLKVILAQRYHTLNLVARSLKTKVPNEPRGCLTFNGAVMLGGICY
jgi:hypothetical protein